MGAALPALSLWFCVKATSPQVHGPGKSLIFFGGISERDVGEYNRDLASLTQQQFLQDLSLQCHRNSVIAASKYRCVGRAMKALVWGVLPWLVGVYLLKAGAAPGVLLQTD